MVKAGSGPENVKKLLKENKELANQLEQKIRQMVGLWPADEAASEKKPD
jgi:hypothetical protein